MGPNTLQKSYFQSINMFQVKKNKVLLAAIQLIIVTMLVNIVTILSQYIVTKLDQLKGSLIPFVAK